LVELTRSATECTDLTEGVASLGCVRREVGGRLQRELSSRAGGGILEYSRGEVGCLGRERCVAGHNGEINACQGVIKLSNQDEKS
jgi:hypothetical protein